MTSRPAWWPTCVAEALELPDREWQHFCAADKSLDEFTVYHQAQYRRADPTRGSDRVVSMGFHSGYGNAGDP